MTHTLGKLIKSNAHTDYVCQIYGPREIENEHRRERGERHKNLCALSVLSG